MTLKDVVYNLLSDLSIAQDEAYRLSYEGLQEQSNNLFPTPYAEISEVNLELSYVFVKGQNIETSKFVFSIFWNDIQETLTSVIERSVRYIVNQIDTDSDSENWRRIRKSMLSGTGIPQLTEAIRLSLKGELSSSTNIENLSNIVADTIFSQVDTIISGHPEIQAVSQGVEITKGLRLQMKTLIKTNGDVLQNAYDKAQVTVQPSMPISVEADVLKEFPEHVQKAKIKLDMKNITKVISQ
ncbi:hypothetical protein [Fulvitalea axinellae]